MAETKTNPISKTAYYCCGVRMQDAESASQVVGDIYARRFMNEEGLKTYEGFKHLKAPNASNISRHRIIDDFLRDFILRNEDPLIVIIGAGFDSRAYRSSGGTWIEFDEPHLIAYKNDRLPISECRNNLQRIPINFAAESLQLKLSTFSKHKSVAVIIEGVFMYLAEPVTNDLLNTLKIVFPRHQLLCDLMSKTFFEKYGYKIHKRIQALGASFSFVADNPASIFINKGYILKDKVSTVEKAVELGLLGIPKIILRWFLRSLIEGYAIYRFETK